MYVEILDQEQTETDAAMIFSRGNSLDPVTRDRVPPCVAKKTGARRRLRSMLQYFVDSIMPHRIG